MLVPMLAPTRSMVRRGADEIAAVIAVSPLIRGRRNPKPPVIALRPRTFRSRVTPLGCDHTSTEMSEGSGERAGRLGRALCLRGFACPENRRASAIPKNIIGHIDLCIQTE